MSTGGAASLKRLAKRSRAAIVAATIADDVWTQLRASRGTAETSDGSTHAELTIEESMRYLDVVFGDYLRYGGLGADDLTGLSVLELGPGDNLGVALRFLAAGAERVVAVDKFWSQRDPRREREIYSELFARLTEPERRRLAGVLTADGELAPGPRLAYRHGVAVERADERFDPESFDLIVSRAVMEHLYDLDAAFAATDRLLRPGGRLLHKIDFRDHGMFTTGGHHPLEFLTVPEPLYARMTRHSGRPNRTLSDYYRKKTAELGYDARLLVAQLVGEEELIPHAESVDDVEVPARARSLVAQIRPRLQRRFAELPDEDLLVSMVFLVATKPGVRPR